MQKRWIRRLLPIIAILAIATIVALNISLFTMAHASAVGHQTHITAPGGITPYSFWPG